MKKTIIINGMTNRFSASKVKEAIESIPGVSATVFLAEKKQWLRAMISLIPTNWSL